MLRSRGTLIGIMLAGVGLLLAQSRSAEIAKAAGEELAKGESAALQARFTGQLKSAMTDQAINEVRTNAFKGAGTFERVDPPECQTVESQGGSVEMCTAPLLFASKRISVQFVIDAQGLIGAMYLVGTENR